jgi:hypothetical protein
MTEQRIIDHEPDPQQSQRSREKHARDLADMIKRELELWPESFTVTPRHYSQTVELTPSGVAIIAQFLKDNL